MENTDRNGIFLPNFRVSETRFGQRKYREGGRPTYSKGGDPRIALMELAGDDCVLDQELERHDLEGIFVGSFEDDGATGSGSLDFEPAGGADTPTVARFEAGKAELRHGGAEVVSERLGGRKEGGVDDAADGVDAMVVGAGLAAAGAVKAGHGLAAADVERLAEDVFAAIFDGFCGGHWTPVSLQYPIFLGENALARQRLEDGFGRGRVSF
jgi:hypothetical protein